MNRTTSSRIDQQFHNLTSLVGLKTSLYIKGDTAKFSLTRLNRVLTLSVDIILDTKEEKTLTSAHVKKTLNLELYMSLSPTSVATIRR